MRLSRDVRLSRDAQSSVDMMYGNERELETVGYLFGAGWGLSADPCSCI